jgi:hypothetical protein
VNWSNGIRQFHRWMSVAFTLAVIVTTVALSQKDPIIWISYVPLFPLALLFVTGLYLWVLPYTAKWRRSRA